MEAPRARHLLPTSNWSQLGGAPYPRLHTPQTRDPRHAVRPPSLRPKTLGFRLLPGANFLPLGKAGSAVWGFAAGRGSEDRLESWRGRTVTTPSVQQEHRSACAPGCARTLSQRPPSSDTGTSEDLARPFCLPLATHAHLVWLARVPALTRGALASAPPGRPRLGLGLPAGLGCVPGLRTRYAGGRGGGERRRLGPPLAPPSSPPLSGCSGNEFQMWPACPGVLGGRRGRFSGPFVHPPHLPPCPSQPPPVRNRLAHDITQPRDFTSLLTRWPEPETAVSRYLADTVLAHP